MLNVIIEGIRQIDGKLTLRFDTLQADINILKARNDVADLYALYDQLDRRMTELEKRIL